MSAAITAGGHTRLRPFNTRDTYPEQNLDNDLCQAVVAGTPCTCAARSPRIWTPARTSPSGDPAGQAEKAMDNIELLLGECGATP